MAPRTAQDETDSSALPVTLRDLSPVYGLLAGVLVWSGFAAAVVAPSSLTHFERNAVFLACGVAALAAPVAVWLYRPDRPTVTIFLASPFVFAAWTLPLVVAILLWGRYPNVPVSTLPNVVAFVEFSLLEPLGLARAFANTFHREGVGYAISWLVYAIPLGWLLGAAIVQLRFLAGADL